MIRIDINKLENGQDGQGSADDVFKCIFMSWSIISSLSIDAGTAVAVTNVLRITELSRGGICKTRYTQSRRRDPNIATTVEITRGVRYAGGFRNYNEFFFWRTVAPFTNMV